MARAAADSKDISARGWSSAPVVLWFTGGQGRPVAIALVALLAVFHIALSEREWSPIRNLLFDAYQRLMPREISRYPVVIVDIDDASPGGLRALALATHALGPADRSNPSFRRSGGGARHHHAGSG